MSHSPTFSPSDRSRRVSPSYFHPFWSPPRIRVNAHDHPVTGNTPVPLSPHRATRQPATDQGKLRPVTGMARLRKRTVHSDRGRQTSTIPPLYHLKDTRSSLIYHLLSPLTLFFPHFPSLPVSSTYSSVPSQAPITPRTTKSKPSEGSPLPKTTAPSPDRLHWPPLQPIDISLPPDR